MKDICLTTDHMVDDETRPAAEDVTQQMEKLNVQDATSPTNTQPETNTASDTNQQQDTNEQLDTNTEQEQNTQPDDGDSGVDNNSVKNENNAGIVESDNT
jgi:hypothetical protein